MDIDHYPGGRRKQEHWAVSLRLVGPSPGVYIELRCEDRPACGFRDAELVTLRVDATDPRFAVTADGTASEAFERWAGLWLIAIVPVALFTVIVALPALYRLRTRPEQYWSSPGRPPAHRGKRKRRPKRSHKRRR